MSIRTFSDGQNVYSVDMMFMKDIKVMKCYVFTQELLDKFIIDSKKSYEYFKLTPFDYYKLYRERF